MISSLGQQWPLEKFPRVRDALLCFPWLLSILCSQELLEGNSLSRLVYRGERRSRAKPFALNTHSSTFADPLMAHLVEDSGLMNVFDSSPVPRNSAMVGVCFPAPNRRSTLGFLGKAQTNKNPTKKPPNPSTKIMTIKNIHPTKPKANQQEHQLHRKTHAEEICQAGWKYNSVSPLASHIRSRNCFCFFGSWGSGLLPYSEHASFDSTRKVKICQTTFAGKGQL